MKLLSVRDMYEHTEKYTDQTVQTGGWVRSLRNSKSFGFIVLNDGTPS